MHTRYANTIQHSSGNNGEFILRNLVPFGKIGVEVIFTVELGKRGNVSPEGEANFYYLLHCFTVNHRKRAWVGHANRANIHVWALFQRVVLASAEHFGISGKLGMNLDSYY